MPIRSFSPCPPAARQPRRLPPDGARTECRDAPAAPPAHQLLIHTAFTSGGRPRRSFRNSQHRRHRVCDGPPIPDGAMASSIGSRPAPTSGKPACCKTSSIQTATSSTTKAASPLSPPSNGDLVARHARPKVAAGRSSPGNRLHRRAGRRVLGTQGPLPEPGQPDHPTGGAPPRRVRPAQRGLGMLVPRAGIEYHSPKGQARLQFGLEALIGRLLSPSRAWNADTGTAESVPVPGWSVGAVRGLDPSAASEEHLGRLRLLMFGLSARIGSGRVQALGLPRRLGTPQGPACGQEDAAGTGSGSLEPPARECPEDGALDSRPLRILRRIRAGRPSSGLPSASVHRIAPSS